MFAKLQSFSVGTVGIGATLLMTSAANAHFIGVVGNNSIDGSLCIGYDCVAEESFGFMTVRLKENNLRLHYQDTSSGASFPTNDWRVIINDSANGGASYYAIEDANAGRQVFRVEAGARSNALYVDDGGRIGVGTSIPSVNIDIKHGNTPTVRLQQDGTSGFAPQTWDMAGNETNFFVRDVTNGSTLPFRIRPDAPNDAIMIDQPDGFVGLGDASPDYPLHIRETGDGNSVIIGIEQTDSTNANTWEIKNNADNGRFSIGEAGENTPFKVYPGAVTNLLRVGLGGGNDRIDITGDIQMTGTITTGGSCSIGCDRVFDQDYEVASIADHNAAMWANGYLPNVGPTVEDGQYNMSEKVLRML
ncbi:MAG: hypothetical protein GY947_13560, partial [Rhodobacteraceae bacterium]|nr:hypothetical protein [Paracoccaceae bacterium]